jgi:hypothetical protein
MKTLAQLFPLPEVEFTFAGFTFPRTVSMLPRKSRQERVRAHTAPMTGPYYVSPKPNETGLSFYLGSDFAPKLRWKWADVANTRIDHTGWYTSYNGDGNKIRGIIMQLPKGRGFIAGWSMGEGWASMVDTSSIYESAEAAAYQADSLAEKAAEHEKMVEYEYQIDELAASWNDIAA